MASVSNRIVHSKKFKHLLEKYIRNEITAIDFAEELKITRPRLYQLFNERIQPNPVQLREKYRQSIYAKASERIANGSSYNDLVDEFPHMFRSKQAVRYLVSEGLIEREEVRE